MFYSLIVFIFDVFFYSFVRPICKTLFSRSDYFVVCSRFVYLILKGFTFIELLRRNIILFWSFWTLRRFVLNSFIQFFPTLIKRFVLRSEEHTSELQSRPHLVCRLLLEKKKIKQHYAHN